MVVPSAVSVLVSVSDVSGSDVSVGTEVSVVVVSVGTPVSVGAPVSVAPVSVPVTALGTDTGPGTVGSAAEVVSV